jgi:hypothetical protein
MVHFNIPWSVKNLRSECFFPKRKQTCRHSQTTEERGNIGVSFTGRFFLRLIDFKEIVPQLRELKVDIQSLGEFSIPVSVIDVLEM